MFEFCTDVRGDDVALAGSLVAVASNKVELTLYNVAEISHTVHTNNILYNEFSSENFLLEHLSWLVFFSPQKKIEHSVLYVQTFNIRRRGTLIEIGLKYFDSIYLRLYFNHHNISSAAISY
jgi:hypothetical protein